MTNTRNRQIDWGGMDLIVRDVKLASKPRAAQTDITSTDLTALAGVTAGTQAASKALIANASAQIPIQRKVILNTATATQTLAASDSGTLYILSKADGIIVTLPVPAVGLNFEFVIDTAWASNSYKIITDAATTFLKGSVLCAVTATPTLSVDTANGTSHVAVTMAGTTTGGLVGTKLYFTCYDATHWHVDGWAPKTGSVATMFTTS